MSRNDNIIDCMVMLVLPLASVMSGCIFDHDVPCPPDAGGSFTIVNDWAEAPGADPAGSDPARHQHAADRRNRSLPGDTGFCLLPHPVPDSQRPGV